MALHSIWGTSTPPGTYTWHTDASPNIWTMMGFYRTVAGTPVDTVVGARLWMSAAAAAANSSVSIRVFRGGQFDAGMTPVSTGWASPIETKTMPITGAGWNEVLFNTSITNDVGERIYLAVQYGATDDGYQHSGNLSNIAVLAEGGWGFCLGDAGANERSAYTIGGGSITEPSNGVMYALDIIYNDGGSSDTTPPSVPAGLSIGSITHNAAVATWTASTDDTAVIGYEVFKDGVSAGTTSSTTFNLTGLTPTTEYDITVRARDAAANWSAQTAAQTFTTDAGPTTGGRWINHVVINAPQNGTSTHTVGPDSGSVAAGTLFTPTAGRFLVCVAEGAVTSSTPTGWTLPSNGAALNATGLYVWHRTAAGGDSLSTTHNASNYPVIFHFFEFAAGTTFIGANFGVNIGPGAAGPTLTGLTGTNLVMYAVAKGITETTGTRTYTWSAGEEIADVLVLRPGGAIDGYHYGLAISEDFTGSTASSAASTGGSLTGGNHERLIFALNVVQESSGDTEAPSVPTGVEVTPASTSATVEWTASTDNVGVTSYEVSLDGTPVGTPTATLLHLTGLTPSTTYEVTVRARDSAANWSASTTAVEFTTLPATRLTIAEENELPGTDQAYWYVLGGAVGDTANVGYARTFSNEVGTTVEFCCTGGGTELQIYRLGWYGGAGARHVDTVTVTPVSQAAGTTIPSSNNGIQFSAWTVNAEWDIPALATSGFYLGVYRNAADNNASWIPFVVKDAARDSDIVYKTADATWMIAYNHYGGPSNQLGGGSFYGAANSMGGGGITTRAHACSYHRPYVTKSGAPLTAFTNAELPMIRWIERMGYEVKYVGCMDLHDSADCLDGASVFVSNGHDEYWSTEMRDNVEAFRDAGGHLLFASGNEVFWRIRRDGTDPNIIWCFKDSMSGPGGHTAGTPLDPVSWTGTWKDTRWGSRRPENLTTGTDFRMNAMSSKTTTFNQAAAYADHPVWRNSALAAGTSQSVLGIVGFEADEMLPVQTGDRVVVLASETYNIDDNRADDNGENYTTDGNLNWGVVAQRYPSGAVVVGFGTVQWSWGLDTMHDPTNSSGAANLSMQQMTYNLLRDLGAAPASPHTGITTSAPVDINEYGLLLEADNLISEYGFDDGVDKTGHGYDLTVVGSPSVTGGHSGGRAATTGATNRFEGPVGPNTSFTDYTVMAWVKYNSFAGTYNSVMSNGSSWFFDFRRNGDDLALYLYSGAGGHPDGLTGRTLVAATDVWMHAAATRAADGTAKVYLDGVLVASGAGNAFNFADTNLEIGSNANGTGYVSDALIDDFRLFDTALTPAQIQAWSEIPVTEDALTTLTKTVASSWSASVAATKTVASSWNASVQATKTVASSWSARVAAAKTVAATWNALQSVTKTVSSEWSATTTATKTVDSTWVTRAQMVKTVVSEWVAEGITYTLTKTVDSTWAARVRVTTTVASSWSALSRHTKTVVSRWQALSDIPPGDDEPADIVLTRRPGGRSARSITVSRRRQ